MGRVTVTLLLMIISIVTCTASNFTIQPYPINFDQVPLSQTVLAGANVSFSCSAAIINEQVLPQFIWYHNNTEITNGNISYTGINMTTLFISNVTEIDQGEYYCIVKDWETRTRTKSCKLIVYSHDGVTKRQHLNVTSNETIILQCNFEDIESGMIQWFRNGNAINLLSKKFYQLQDGSLVILHINSSDDEEYSCNATLNGGHVKLLSYKIVTTQVDTKQFNGEAVVLYPENSTDFTANMTVVCKIPPLLEFYNVTWTRNGTVISLATEGVEVIEYNLIKIRDMNVSSNEYRCVVYKNSSDESPIISSSLVIYKYSVPVVKHSNTTNYYICVNLSSTDVFSCVNGTVQTVNLYCNSVGGFPIPTVTWFHNGDEIIHANIINGTLMLNKSACDLLGTYQCVVSNEIGSKITVFRVLPFGWPNAPMMPKLSTKGRILYINWKSPVYLGGLNSSLISFEAYKTDDIYKKHNNLTVEGYDCSSVDHQCSLTVPYRDLRNGIEEIYYVKLKIKRSANWMCPRYRMPDTIPSMKSSIDFTKIVEYGPPKVNLNCSGGYANMTSQSSGSLSADEFWNNGFVKGCEVNWNCTNGTSIDHEYIYTKNCNYDFEIPWRSYNCSVDVVHIYRGPIEMPKVSAHCLSNNYTQEPNPTYENTDISLIMLPTYTLSEIAPLTQAASSTVNIANKTTSPVMTTQVTPTLSSLLITSGSSLVDTSTFMPVTANQATSTLSPLPIRNGYGSSLVDSSSTIAAITLSSVIVLVLFVFIAIFIGIFCCKRRKEQIYKFNMTERGFHCSLDSIPKAYSYIGREDQSVCEKPNQKVASWINSLDDSEEVTTINSDDLSNEQMLDALYGISKTKRTTAGENAFNVNAMQGSSINEDEISTVSSTLLTDYMDNSTTVKSDIPMANSAKCNSTLPVVMVEHVETSDCQKTPRNSETQNNALSISHSLKSVDNISDNNQMLAKNEMKGQDTYVSLSNKSKKRSAGTDLSDHGEYIEYDDIARKQTAMGQNHNNKS